MKKWQSIKRLQTDWMLFMSNIKCYCSMKWEKKKRKLPSIFHDIPLLCFTEDVQRCSNEFLAAQTAVNRAACLSKGEESGSGCARRAPLHDSHRLMLADMEMFCCSKWWRMQVKLRNLTLTFADGVQKRRKIMFFFYLVLHMVPIWETQNRIP